MKIEVLVYEEQNMVKMQKQLMSWNLCHSIDNQSDDIPEVSLRGG